MTGRRWFRRYWRSSERPEEGETRFSIVRSAAENRSVRRTARSCPGSHGMPSRVPPQGFRSPVGLSGSPDSWPLPDGTSIVSSRVKSGKGGSFLQCVDVQGIFSYFFEITREAFEYRRELVPDRAIRPARPSTPSACCRSCCGRYRPRGSGGPDIIPGLPISTRELLMMRSPRHAHGELLHRGPFMMRSPFGRPQRGADLLVETTCAVAVPPRISTRRQSR
jgi:hypothetical protein